MNATGISSESVTTASVSATAGNYVTVESLSSSASETTSAFSTNSTLLPGDQYDYRGATFFCVTVIVLYSFSIAAMVFKSLRSHKRSTDPAIDHYIKELPAIQLEAKREQWRKWRDDVILPHFMRNFHLTEANVGDSDDVDDTDVTQGLEDDSIYRHRERVLRVIEEESESSSDDVVVDIDNNDTKVIVDEDNTGISHGKGLLNPALCRYKDDACNLDNILSADSGREKAEDGQSTSKDTNANRRCSPLLPSLREALQNYQDDPEVSSLMEKLSSRLRKIANKSAPSGKSPKDKSSRSLDLCDIQRVENSDPMQCPSYDDVLKSLDVLEQDHITTHL